LRKASAPAKRAGVFVCVGINNCMKVFQVQAIDVRGRIRIVHAYKTADEAQSAIKTMKSRSKGIRYVIVEVTNDSGQHWGLDEAVKTVRPRRKNALSELKS
jgi:hypothetical protein